MYPLVSRSIRNKMRSAQVALVALARLFAYHEMCIARVVTAIRSWRRWIVGWVASGQWLVRAGFPTWGPDGVLTGGVCLPCPFP